MADIELVVKIPEEAYNFLQNGGVDWLGAEHILDRVANGIPLPKGHGDLIDRDEILQGEHFVVLGDVKAGDKNFGEREIDMFPKQTIMSIKPVIEADKGE